MMHHGQPPYRSPEAPPKPTHPLVWVGVGCAALFFLVMIGAAAAAFFLARHGSKGGVSASGVFSAGVAVSIDGGAVSIDASASTGVPPGARPGSAVCEQAADCCRRAVEKTGGSAAALASCDGLRTNAAEAGCRQALEAYRASPLFGAVCP
jgi:hypothetical protein